MTIRRGEEGWWGCGVVENILLIAYQHVHVDQLGIGSSSEEYQISHDSNNLGTDYLGKKIEIIEIQRKPSLFKLDHIIS